MGDDAMLRCSLAYHRHLARWRQKAQHQWLMPDMSDIPPAVANDLIVLGIDGSAKQEIPIADEHLH